MQTIAVIGAGQMGSGISQTIAQHGMKVLLADIDIAVAEKAKEGIDAAMTKLVGRGKLEAADAEAALARITPVADYEPMTEADIYPGFTKDIYVSLGEAVNDQGDWAVRIYLKPFIRWMWFGGLMMMAGAVIALFSKRTQRLEQQQADAVMQERLKLS